MIKKATKNKIEKLNISDDYIADQVREVVIDVYTKHDILGSHPIRIKLSGSEIKKNLSLHQVASHFLGYQARMACELAVGKDLIKGEHRPSYFLTDFTHGELDKFFEQKFPRIFLEHDEPKCVKKREASARHAECVYFKIRFYDVATSKYVERKYHYATSKEARMEIDIANSLWKLKTNKR